MNSNSKTARVAGLLYLLVIVFGVFAELSVRQKLIVWDDAAATASNILSNEWLFRFGFISDFIMSVCWLLLPLALYVLLKEINKKAAALMVIFVIIGTAMQCMNLLNQFSALMILKGGEYLSPFTADQLNAQALFYLNLHKYGYMSAGIFHGLWLLPLAYLVYKSEYFPKIFGILLAAAFIGFEIEFFGRFIFPNYGNYGVIISIAAIASVLGEFSFCGWLLIKGVKTVKKAI